MNIFYDSLSIDLSNKKIDFSDPPNQDIPLKEGQENKKEKFKRFEWILETWTTGQYLSVPYLIIFSCHRGCFIFMRKNSDLTKRPRNMIFTRFIIPTLNEIEKKQQQYYGTAPVGHNIRHPAISHEPRPRSFP